jgi:hypothetical protein
MKWSATVSVLISILALGASCFQGFLSAQSLRDSRVAALLTRRIDACSELHERARFITNRAELFSAALTMPRFVPAARRSGLPFASLEEIAERQVEAFESLRHQCGLHPNAYTLQLLGPEAVSRSAAP